MAVRASGALRWLVLPEYGVKILKYIGDFDGPLVTERLRAFYSAHPESLLQSTVNDLRAFRGSVGYRDMTELAAALRPVQPANVRRKSVLLTHDKAAVYVARLASDIFEWSDIEVHREPDKAFAAATGGAAMPEAARAFFEAR